MIQVIRTTGFVLIAAGVLGVLCWLIEPLQSLWYFALRLPVPLQLGGGTALLGFLLLLGSLIAERISERKTDEELLDKSPPSP